MPAPSPGELPIIQTTHVASLVEEVGRQLGGWISQQRRQRNAAATA